MQFRNNQDILKEVSKKLIPIAKQQNIESKLVSRQDIHEKSLQLIENKISNQINMQKNLQFNIEEKALNKIETIINFFSKLQPSTLSSLSSGFSIKQNKETQTDKDQTQILLEKVETLTKEKENMSKAYEALQKENQVLSKENEEIKLSEQKMLKENNLLHNTIDDITKNNLENMKNIQTLQIENKKLNDLILEYKNKISELTKSNKILEDKIINDLEKKQFKEKILCNSNKQSSYNNLVKFYALINSQNLKNIISFLNCEDVCNLKLTSKVLSIEIANSADILRNFYSKIITHKNKKISSLQKYEIKQEYLVNNAKLETLIKDYAVFNNRVIGKDLKFSIGKCLNFMNKDVKIPLGYQPARIKNSNETSGISTPSYMSNQGQTDNSSSAYSTFFGGIKNMLSFNYGVSSNPGNPNQSGYFQGQSRTGYQTPNSQIGGNKGKYYSKQSSLNSSFMSNNVNDFKNYLNEYEKTINNEIDDNDLGIASNYEFDFASPDDILVYLHRFLKSNFSADKLTSFIKQLAFGYSELLFFAKKTLTEAKELNIVKNALNERFKFFQKLAKDYEKKLIIYQNNTQQAASSSNKVVVSRGIENAANTNELASSMIKNTEEINKAVQEENEKLKKEIEGNKYSLLSFQTKANLYKRKYEDVIVDFQLFKNVFGRENKNLKYMYEKVMSEKNELEKKIENFQKYFKETIVN